MFKWGFQCIYLLIWMQLTYNAPLALQGALHPLLAADVNGVSVSAGRDKHPTSNT